MTDHRTKEQRGEGEAQSCHPEPVEGSLIPLLERGVGSEKEVEILRLRFAFAKLRSE
jgi:hypothetical protein